MKTQQRCSNMHLIWLQSPTIRNDMLYKYSYYDFIPYMESDYTNTIRSVFLHSSISVYAFITSSLQEPLQNHWCAAKISWLKLVLKNLHSHIRVCQNLIDCDSKCLHGVPSCENLVLCTQLLRTNTFTIVPLFGTDTYIEYFNIVNVIPCFCI